MHTDRRSFLKQTSAAALLAACPSWASRLGAAEPLPEWPVPPSSKPGCYWWWFNGRVSKEGITRDLEAFAAQGIGELLLVNSAGEGIPQGHTLFSDGWRDCFRHALCESRRLRITMGINLCSGWVMGGPWIPPRHSGRWYLQSTLTVTGPRRFKEKLPLPGGHDGYSHLSNAPGYKDYLNLPLSELDYRDASVVAFPEAGANQDKLGALDPRHQTLTAKANRQDGSNFLTASQVMGPTLSVWADSDGDRPVPPDQVVDLTAHLSEDGSLDWDVPAGTWTIVRTGHRMTGSKVTIPQPEAGGLSVDWFDGKAVELQFEHFGKKILEDAAPYVGTTVTFFADDSFEDGFPNWTERFLERFKTLRGYEATRYLPVLSGYLIGSAEISERFLYDYRKTVADCMAEGHYGRFRELCREHGLLAESEAAGPSRSGTVCLDGYKNLARSDRPAGEFWLGLRHDEPGGLDPSLGYGTTRLEGGQNKVTKMVASVAHLSGQPLVTAEAFTTYRHWRDSPATLKPAADRAFCEGINRFFVHESTSTIPEDGLPGYEYFAGTHFNRNVTWWPMVGPFLTYLGRCQDLLRQGTFVADVLFYRGDWAPNPAIPKHVDPSLGPGYDYDDCGVEAILTQLSVRDGLWTVPGGGTYRLLVLPDVEAMPLEVLKVLEMRVREGGTLVGRPPRRSTGLQHYPTCDGQVLRLAASLWGEADGARTTRSAVGRGRVIWNEPLREILVGDGILPDLEAPPQVDFIHRRIGSDDVYFVVNKNPDAFEARCRFRSVGSEPELWDPVSGRKFRAPRARRAGRQWEVTVPFEGHASFFVVFPGTARAPLDATPGVLQPFLALDGPFAVAFDPKWGGPSSVAFEGLQDWTHRPEPGIRYYSGTARYERRFRLSELPKSRSWLDLGAVKDIARVRLNGIDLGIVWTAPWRCEVTPALVAGENLLEVEVTNLWPNRLVGDAALPREKRLTHTNISVKPDQALLPSGWLGPARLLHEST